jgi:chitin disaccharide deacetylase
VRSKRYLIVNADDFGYSRSVNRGVIEAHERGIVTSASLMVDRAAAVEAAEYAREHPRLGVGLHLELDVWRVARIPRKGVVRSTAALERRVSAQSADQLERFRSLVGRDPSHLDSHHHRHVWDGVRPVLERLARELDVPLRRCDARVRFCGAFYGHDGKGRPDPDAITPEALVALLEGLEPGVTELCCHAGYADELDDWYRTEREQEVRTLCDPIVRETLVRLEIELCTFEVVRSLQVGAPGT